MPWEESDDYIRSGHEDPAQFEHLATVDNQTKNFEWLPNGVKALFGPRKTGEMGIQNYLFSKAEGWTMEKAKTWFTEHGKKESLKESFKWLPPLFPTVGDNLAYGVAMVEGETLNRTLITPEELMRGARTLVDKVLTIDHYDAESEFKLPDFYKEKYPGIDDPYPVGIILDAEEEDGKLEWIGIVENKTAYQLIKDNKMKGCSVWMKPRQHLPVNGMKPIGIVFEDLTLCLEAYPASSGTWVKPVPTDLILTLTDSRFAQLREALFSHVSKNIDERREENKKMEKGKEVEWDQQYIDGLPDSAFAIISAGGSKDESEKTVPRTLRHLEHHNVEGEVDLPHVQDALTKLDQTDLSAEEKTTAKTHLEAHMTAKELLPPKPIAEKILKIDDAELAKLEKSVETARGLLQAVEQRLEIMIYGKPESNNELTKIIETAMNPITEKTTVLDKSVSALEKSVTALESKCTMLKEIVDKLVEEKMVGKIRFIKETSGSGVGMVGDGEKPVEAAEADLQKWRLEKMSQVGASGLTEPERELIRKFGKPIS